MPVAPGSAPLRRSKALLSSSSPGSHQLMSLAGLGGSLRPSCWQPGSGRDSQSKLQLPRGRAGHSTRMHEVPMADSALNHSWPALSKLWLKRWAFKRGKEASSGPLPRQKPLNHWFTSVFTGVFFSVSVQALSKSASGTMTPKFAQSTKDHHGRWGSFS